MDLGPASDAPAGSRLSQREATQKLGDIYQELEAHHFRRQHIQRALQVHRLAWNFETGCRAPWRWLAKRTAWAVKYTHIPRQSERPVANQPASPSATAAGAARARHEPRGRAGLAAAAPGPVGAAKAVCERGARPRRGGGRRARQGAGAPGAVEAGAAGQRRRHRRGRATGQARPTRRPGTALSALLATCSFVIDQPGMAALLYGACG